MRIVLIGFMGSGKSTVGKLLAERVGYRLHEMDELIIHRSGLSSVPEIFDHRGEQGFRDLEAETARELAGAQRSVISTGGGIISRDENMEVLGGPDALIVYLRTAFDTLANRLGTIEDRPLFRDRKNAKDLFERRAPVYERWAQLVVDTDDKTPAQICAEIVSQVEKE